MGSLLQHLMKVFHRPTASETLESLPGDTEPRHCQMEGTVIHQSLSRKDYREDRHSLSISLVDRGVQNPSRPAPRVLGGQTDGTAESRIATGNRNKKRPCPSPASPDVTVHRENFDGSYSEQSMKRIRSDAEEFVRPLMGDNYTQHSRIAAALSVHHQPVRQHHASLGRWDDRADTLQPKPKDVRSGSHQEQEPVVISLLEDSDESSSDQWYPFHNKRKIARSKAGSISFSEQQVVVANPSHSFSDSGGDEIHAAAPPNQATKRQDTMVPNCDFEDTPGHKQAQHRQLEDRSNRAHDRQTLFDQHPPGPRKMQNLDTTTETYLKPAFRSASRAPNQAHRGQLSISDFLVPSLPKTNDVPQSWESPRPVQQRTIQSKNTIEDDDLAILEDQIRTRARPVDSRLYGPQPAQFEKLQKAPLTQPERMRNVQAYLSAKSPPAPVKPLDNDGRLNTSTKNPPDSLPTIVPTVDSYAVEPTPALPELQHDIAVASHSSVEPDNIKDPENVTGKDANEVEILERPGSGGNSSPSMQLFILDSDPKDTGNVMNKNSSRVASLLNRKADSWVIKASTAVTKPSQPLTVPETILNNEHLGREAKAVEVSIGSDKKQDAAWRAMNKVKAVGKAPSIRENLPEKPKGPISLHRLAETTAKPSSREIVSKGSFSQQSQKTSSTKKKGQSGVISQFKKDIVKEQRLRDSNAALNFAKPALNVDQRVQKQHTHLPSPPVRSDRFVDPHNRPADQSQSKSTVRQEIRRAPVEAVVTHKHNNQIAIDDSFVRVGYHPRTGGKSYNPKVFKTYIRELEKAEEELDFDIHSQSTTSSADQREETPFNEPDYVHWEYQVWRKTWSINESEEEAYWAVCGGETCWTTLPEANAAAGREVLRRRNGFGLGPTVTNYNFNLDESGMAHYYADSSKGHTRVKVDRFLRNATHGKKPSSKLGWLRKYVYDIKRRTTATIIKAIYDTKPSADDDLFEEEVEERQEELETVEWEVVDGPYTILDQANRDAAELVLASRRSKLTARYDDFFAQQEREKSMGERLDRLEQSNELFSERIEFQQERKVVEIWVERRELKGPRNI